MPAPQKHHARNQTLSKTKKTSGKAKRSPGKLPARPDAEIHGLGKTPLEIQQLVLDIFKTSFPETFGGNLQHSLKLVKLALFNRDFLEAFGRDDYLAAYAVRWSASRALGYLSILHDVLGTIIDSKECGQVSSLSKPASYPPDLLGICCFGGGAGAELVSIAAAVHLLRKSRMGSASLEEKQSSEGEEDKDVAVPTNLDETGIPKVSVLLVDLANWHAVTQALYGSITTAPKLSQYASVAVKAANIPFVSCEDLSQALEVTDVLALSSDHLAQLVGSNVKLVTIFFTLNELYTTSRARTQAFLLELTMFIRPGSFLLVVDSAGSYSTVELNGAEKKYPMHWLLDHTLLKVATATSLRNGEEGVQSESKEKGAQEQEYSRWEKLREEESAWFRIPEGLKYPLELENMRYQLHLYRRLEQQ